MVDMPSPKEAGAVRRAAMDSEVSKTVEKILRTVRDILSGKISQPSGEMDGFIVVLRGILCVHHRNRAVIDQYVEAMQQAGYRKIRVSPSCPRAVVRNVRNHAWFQLP